MFSFFLRSGLVATNLLQFIKFLSRTQSLFFKGENRKLSPGAVRLYYVRSEPGVHIHTPAGRIYRTMQPAAYPQTEWPALRQSVKRGHQSLSFCIQLYVPAVQAHGQTILCPFAANVQGHTDKKRDCEFFRSLFFTYRYACANRLAHTPSPLSQKSKQYTYESVSTQSPGYIASECGFCTVFSSTILFCRISNTVAP